MNLGADRLRLAPVAGAAGAGGIFSTGTVLNVLIDRCTRVFKVQTFFESSILACLESFLLGYRDTTIDD